MVLFHHLKVLKSRFYNHNFYGDYFSDDDYWKLGYLMGLETAPKNPHPFLGWAGKFDSVTYRHNDEEGIHGRTPVILYGDSFAACATPVCCQQILNKDQDFAKKYYLLNYGVDGYGVDQIELLYEKSKDLYDKPIVIMSFLTEDLDRSMLSFREGQKPYYDVKDGYLVLKGVPIDSSTRHFIMEHPVGSKSYLWNYITHYWRFPEKVKNFLQDYDPKVQSKKKVNSIIIQNVIDDLRERHIPFFFIVFEGNWPDKIEGPDSWRATFAKVILQKNHVPYIWTKDLILEDSKKTGKDISEYFLKVNGHYTEYTNALVARKIKEMILNQKYENPVN